MALSIADQIALDDALVALADRLKIGKCNLRLSSDVTLLGRQLCHGKVLQFLEETKVNWHYARDDHNVYYKFKVIQGMKNQFPPKTKGSKKKANTDTIPKLKPPTAPTEKKSGKGKLKTISEAELTEAEQLKLITKRSRQENSQLSCSGLGADEGNWCYSRGSRMQPDYGLRGCILEQSSDDVQVDEASSR
ncbi:hypothetical protein Tco_1131771 [Tanacetum coccineum]|uniref:Uncharacterized protein n=1 Tax=Tanacetum coccineum TaxID=301880 RepID=A0ABQ5JA12_9ASTR